jgi:hypothetical protein
MGGIQYLVRPDRLEVFPIGQTADGIARGEEFLGNVLEQLPHTPIIGIGHNFTFVDRTPGTLSGLNSANVDLVDRMDSGFDLISPSVGAVITNPARTILINISRVLDGGVLTTTVNVHHPVTSVESARAVLAGEGDYKRMHDNLLTAKKLLDWKENADAQIH